MKLSDLMIEADDHLDHMLDHADENFEKRMIAGDYEVKDLDHDQLDYVADYIIDKIADATGDGQRIVRTYWLGGGNDMGAYAEKLEKMGVLDDFGDVKRSELHQLDITSKELDVLIRAST